MTAAKALVSLKWQMMKQLVLQSLNYTILMLWSARLLLMNQLHVQKAKEAASKRRASVAAAEAVAVVDTAAVDTVVVVEIAAEAAVDTTVIVETAVEAEDLTDINIY
jgi:hypothetical protein